MQDTYFKEYVNYCIHKINSFIQKEIAEYVYLHPSEFTSPRLDPKDPKLRKRLGENGYKLIEKKYNINSTVNKYENEYLSMLN